METVVAMKNLIRLGIRFVPNRLGAYRLFSHLAPILIRPPAGCAIDKLEVGDRSAVWLAHPHHCDARVVLYLHGGGYTIGSNRTHVELAGRLARAARAQVLMIDYRLAPENPFPAAIEDAIAAYQYLLDRRVGARQIILAGDSAGGGLAVALALAIRDLGLPRPAAVVGISPWLDLSCKLSSAQARQSRDPLISPARIDFFASQYLGGHERTHPWISPLYGDLRGLPPMLIQVGSDEILLPECKTFARLGRRAGTMVRLEEWPDMFHVWHFAAGLLPEGRQAIGRIGRFSAEVAPASGRPSLIGGNGRWATRLA